MENPGVRHRITVKIKSINHENKSKIPMLLNSSLILPFETMSGMDKYNRDFLFKEKESIEIICKRKCLF